MRCGEGADDGDRAARHIAARDFRAGAFIYIPHQPAGVIHAADAGVDDPHLADDPAGGERPEQPGVVAAAAGQVADGVPVAVELRAIRRCLRPDRHPVGVRIGGSGADAHLPIAIGVEVQAFVQLVADAGIGAAHPGGTGAQQIRVAERPEIPRLRRRGRGIRPPIPVQVIADGIQLLQGIHIDQIVVVRVVAHPALRIAGRHGVLARGAEVPNRRVPVGVNPGVARGGLQLERGLDLGGASGPVGLADAGGGVPGENAVAVGDDAGGGMVRMDFADQSA